MRKLLLFCLFLIPLVSAYQIVGDCVKYENQHGLLQVCPHTSSKFQNQEQFFNITNKHDLEIPLNISAEFPAGIQPRVFLREGGKWIEKFTYSGTIVFQPLQSRYFKLLYNSPINSTGKFNISMSYGEYEAKIDPWWNATWGYRAPINVSETMGTDRFQEPLVLNITSLTDVTNCSYLRVTANYSTETEIVFNIINETGLSETDGDKWCEILWLVNMTTVKNASYVTKNETNYWVYYSNLSNVDPNAFTELRAWDKSVQGWRAFNAEPAPHTYDFFLGTGTANTLYYAGNAVQELNSTNYYAYKNSSAGLPSGAKTLEFRARITSDFTDNLFFFGALGSTAEALIGLRNASAVGVSKLTSGNAFLNYVTDANPYVFHKYRLLFNDATTTYQLYIDDVLRVTGTNASAVSDNALWLGSYVGTSGGDGEIDYAFIKLSGWLPPLEAVVGAGELPPNNPPTYSNYGFNVTNSSPYNSSITYLTWAEWDDDYGISTVIFNLNETNKTYSENITGNYSVEWGNLAAGDYSFFTCSNDTSSQWNCTATQTFEILQANTAANLLLNGTDGNKNYFSYETLNATGYCTGVSGTLTRNGTPIANPYYASLAGGTYNFTITCTGNQNYTTTSEQHDANVTQVVTPTPSPVPSPTPVVAGVFVETVDGYALTIPLLKKECNCYGLNIPFVNWCLWGWICTND